MIRTGTLAAARDAVGRIFFQRCFYLFAVLMAFIVIVPFVPLGTGGKIIVLAVNSLVFVAAVAAVGRSVLSFVIVILLAGATLFFFWQSSLSEDPRHFAWTLAFSSALGVVTIVYLLQYVFLPDVMSADKLFGAAAAYLMIGYFWANLYALVDYFYPGSFKAGLGGLRAEFFDYVYFSYTVLTSTGFGDIVPNTRQARAVCLTEQLTGALYVAILIARLAGVYPPARRLDEDTK